MSRSGVITCDTPLMLLIICTKYGKNPSCTVDATGRTRKVNGQTDRQTDRQTDGRTDGRTDRQADGRMDRRMDGRTDGRTDRQTG